MFDFIKKNLFIGAVVLLVILSFYRTIFSGLLPIPSDTIIGLYHPFRDIYAKDYPNGIPYKNFLITDPVRQTYPWKNLGIEIEKKLELPIWNPYSFSGTPLLANFQTGAFYPLSVVFLPISFETAWSIFIILQPLLGGVFMYLYLTNLKLRKEARLLGSIAFSFSGFFVAWLEWGNILHTAIWLPLILLSVDKIIDTKEKLKLKNIWPYIFLFSITSSFLAGHLQTFFYILVISSIHIVLRVVGERKSIKTILLFGALSLIAAAITFVQWYPTLQYIILSARDADLIPFTQAGWFIPPQNIVQFFAPDFFGNPTTLNYWGVWNYGEFIGYVGVAPLMLAIHAVIFRRGKPVLFYAFALVISLLFAFSNPIAKLPFVIGVPFLETSQPTRLIFLAVFSLSVLAALGLDSLLKDKGKRILFVVSGFVLIYSALWIFVTKLSFNLATVEDLLVSRQNLIFPTAIFLASALLIVFVVFSDKHKLIGKIRPLLILLLIGLTAFDLLRFMWKFEPFTKRDYLFPDNKVISLIKNDKTTFRVASLDSRILPPNFSVMYKVQTADGYDPLYLKRYGELMAAFGRGKPDISSPFGFNRIITLQNINSKLFDFLGNKYVLSLDDVKSDKLTKILAYGQTKVYRNNKAFERAFFVGSVSVADSKQQAIELMMDPKILLSDVAVVEGDRKIGKNYSLGKADIVSYSENEVIVKTTNSGEGFLVLTDAYYPSFTATIDGRPAEIYLTDYAFRGLIVPKGEHTVEFKANLL